MNNNWKKEIVDRDVNLYKVIFIGEEREAYYAGYELRYTEPPKMIRAIYQTYVWAAKGEQAIGIATSMAEDEKIKVLDFTKVSLVVSDQSINRLMKELL